MDSTRAVTEAPAEPLGAPRAVCPVCGSLWGELDAVPVALFDGAAFRRCSHCGTRRALAPLGASESPIPSSGVGPDFNLGELPRLVGTELLDPGADTDCGLPPADRVLAEATEREVTAALAARWRFVSDPRSSQYLDRLARATAATVEGAPEDCRVLLFDDPTGLRLALPSGRLLFSLGALRSIEDEAELVFVLGHELAHVAGGDAARRLSALGLAGLSRSGGRYGDHGWLEAAQDLIRLGHGESNEYRADLSGLRGVLALGYDPKSAIHYVRRLRDRMEDGDSHLAVLALAHPLPVDRLRRLQKTWGAHVRDAGASRVNRDSFRRAVGHSAMVTALETVHPFPELDPVAETARRVPWRDWRLIGTGVAILLLAAVFLLVGLLLSR